MATIRNLIVRISVTENTDKGIRKVTTSLRETNREIDSADKSGGRFRSTLSRLGGVRLGGLTSGLSMVTKFTKTAVVGLTAVAGAVSALNTAVQAGVALAPLTGLLALIPGIALGAATAIGTLKLATSGLDDAFKAAMGDDPKKFTKALQDLSPAARGVAIELHKLRPELLGLRNTAQQALFAPLQGQLTAVARVLLGPLRQGVAQVAHQFGLAGRQAAEFARQSATAGVLRAAFANVAVSIHQLIPAMQPVLAGLRGLASVGLTFLPGLAAGASRAATSFGVWLQQIVASGQAAQWISNALATLKQLGGVIANVGGILKSVFSAASAAGSNFLGVIGAALGQLNAFLKTSAGQSALQSLFTGLAQIGRSLAPVLAAIVTQLGTLAGPVGRLATLVGPILSTAITALGPAIAALAPGVDALLRGLSGAITALAPALVPLGNAIAQIGIAIGPVLPLVGQLVGQLVSGLAPILGRIIIALGPVLGAIVKLAGAFTPLIPPLAQIILQLVQGLAPILIALEPIFSQVVTIVGQFLIKALTMMMTALQPLLPVITQVATQIGTSLITVLIALSPALLDVLEALLPLLPSLISMAPVIADLIVKVTPLIVLLIRLSAAILRTLLPPVISIVGWLLRFNATVWGSTIGAVSHVVGAIGHLPGQILRALSGAGRLLVNVGKDIVYGLWNGIASLGNWLWDRIWSWVKSVLPGPIKFALGIHSPSRVMAELGRFAGMGLAVGIDASRSGVAAAAGRLAGAAVPSVTAFAAPAGVAATAGTGAAALAGRGGMPDVKTLAAAISQALSGAAVHMDGQKVGQIVSRSEGRRTDQRRRTG